MKLTAAAILFGLVLVPVMPAVAGQHDHDGPAMGQGQAMDPAWADGTVKKVNADAGKVTISHGPLTSLDMPAMTMVFRISDPAMLDQMKPGNRIRFVVERLGGALTVTALQPGR